MDYAYINTLLDTIHKASGLGSKLGNAIVAKATAELQAYWDAPPVEADEVEEEEEA